VLLEQIGGSVKAPRTFLGRGPIPGARSRVCSAYRSVDFTLGRIVYRADGATSIGGLGDKAVASPARAGYRCAIRGNSLRESLDHRPVREIESTRIHSIGQHVPRLRHPRMRRIRHRQRVERIDN
jgi:hypothetical protein